MGAGDTFGAMVGIALLGLGLVIFLLPPLWFFENFIEGGSQGSSNWAFCSTYIVYWLLLFVILGLLAEFFRDPTKEAIERHKENERKEAFNERVRIAREDLDRQVKAKMEEIIPLATRIFPVARSFEYEAEITTFNSPLTAKSGMSPPKSRVSFISDIGKVKIKNPHSKTLEQMDRKLVKKLERLSNPVRKSKKKKQSRKCEEKWDSLCSGQGDVRYAGKWMCYHCEREYEYRYVHDDA